MLRCLQADPENANVYIGNLAAEVTDIVLRQHVAQFGAVLDVKIYRKGGYAFAQVHHCPCFHLEAMLPCCLHCDMPIVTAPLMKLLRMRHSRCMPIRPHSKMDIGHQGTALAGRVSANVLTDMRLPVQYAAHADAVRAIVGLSGQNLGGKALKCSWGRHQARKGGSDPLQAGLAGAGDFSYAALQQQQQISLQQQLAMQQPGYLQA